MRYAEVNVLGVYISPLVPMLIVAWLVTTLLRRVANRFGLLQQVWHPALFVFSVYLVVLSSIVILAGS